MAKKANTEIIPHADGCFCKRLTNKDIDEITISREWAKKTAVAFCDRTGQVLITCPQQYFAYYDELLEWAVDSEEIPFVIANTAKFKSLTSPECIKP